MLTQEQDGIGGYMAHPEGAADLAWPLVTDFLQRTI